VIWKLDSEACRSVDAYQHECFKARVDVLIIEESAKPDPRPHHEVLWAHFGERVR